MPTSSLYKNKNNFTCLLHQTPLWWRYLLRHKAWRASVNSLALHL